MKKVLTLKVTADAKRPGLVAVPIGSLSTVDTYTMPLRAPLCQTLADVRERAERHAGDGVEVRLVDARLLPLTDVMVARVGEGAVDAA